MEIPKYKDSLALLLKYSHHPSRVELVQEFDPIEAELDFALPANYKYFLMSADGCETVAPLNYCRFYGLSELLPNYRAQHPPNCLPIASDDGNEYAFDLRRNRASADYEVVSYPLSSLEWSDVEWVAEDFSELLWLMTRRLGKRRKL